MGKDRDEHYGYEQFLVRPIRIDHASARSFPRQRESRAACRESVVPGVPASAGTSGQYDTRMIRKCERSRRLIVQSHKLGLHALTGGAAVAGPSGQERARLFGGLGLPPPFFGTYH